MTMSGRQPQHRETNGQLFAQQRMQESAKPAEVQRLRDVMGRAHDQLAHLPREERKRVLRALLALEGES